LTALELFQLRLDERNFRAGSQTRFDRCLIHTNLSRLAVVCRAWKIKDLKDWYAMLLPRLVSRTGVMRLEAQLHFPVLLSHKRRVFEPHMGLLWVLKHSGPLGSVDEAKKQRRIPCQHTLLR
jgi:hypothetical protein